MFLTRITSYVQLSVPDSDNFGIILRDMVPEDNIFCVIRNYDLSDGLLYMSELSGEQAKLVRGALQTYLVKSYGKHGDGSATHPELVTTLFSSFC